MCLSLASPPNRILARFDVRTTVSKKFNPAGWPFSARPQQPEGMRSIRRGHEHGCGRRTGSPLEWAEWRVFETRGGAVMRSAISALAGFALAGSFAFAQPTDGRLKIIHETATLRVAYRTDSRPRGADCSPTSRVQNGEKSPASPTWAFTIARPQARRAT